MAPPPGKSKVINPPNLLKNKVSIPGGISEKDAAGTGEQAIRRKTDAYMEWAATDLDEFQRLMVETRGQAQRFDASNPFYRKLHDIKGQAGTFGFTLISAVGDILGGYLDEMGEGIAEEPVILMHVRAMRLILTQNLKGSGGPVERELLDGLSRVVAKSLDARKRK